MQAIKNNKKEQTKQPMFLKALFAFFLYTEYDGK